MLETKAVFLMAERMIFLQNVYFDLGLQSKRLFEAADVFYLSFK